jgi:hypothetical protein
MNYKLVSHGQVINREGYRMPIESLFILIPVVLLLVAMLLWLRRSKEAKTHPKDWHQTVEHDLRALKWYRPTQILRVDFGVVSFDNSSKQFVYSDGDSHRVLKFSDILGVALLRDNISVSSADSTGRVLGSAYGTARRMTTGTIQSVKLTLLTTDPSSPNIIVDFLTSTDPISVNDSKARLALEESAHWFSIVSLIIRKSRNGGVWG